MVRIRFCSHIVYQKKAGGFLTMNFIAASGILPEKLAPNFVCIHRIFARGFY